MADGSTNLQIQQQITEMYRAQNQYLTAQARLMRGQLAMMEQMVAVQQNLDIDDVRGRFAGARAELDALDETLQRMGGSGQAAFGNVAAGANTSANAIDALGDSLISAGEKAQQFGAAGMMLEGMKKGWDFVKHSISATASVLGTVWQAITDIGTTIIGALLGPFEALFEMANKSVGSNEFMQAREEVRKFFGSLVTNEGAAVMKMYGDLRKGIAETGLSTYRVLGNRADQLKAMNEIAQGLGNTFGALVSGGLIKSSGAVVAFQKGLGITNEQLKEFGRVALTTGRSLDEVFRETSNYAIQLGKAFGISSKLIGRDIAEMTADLKHFGGLGAKAFAEISVYARKLGLEVKSLTGLMDAFDNFDKAADATARLNQQFGIQLDTMQMLKAENPAERADLLRKGFDQAGLSIDNLDRRSKSYGASLINLSEAEAELLFNSKNRGMSLDDIKKKSAEAEKKQLTQAEATKLLADNIERLVRSMQGSGGLFDRFMQGFFRGIEISREFRQIMINIRQIFRSVYYAGRELGRAFVQDFPGIREIFGGYADFFDPARWRKMFRNIVDAFKEFFITIQTDPAGGLQVLWNKLKTAFFGHMDSSEPAGRKLIDGFKKFFETILGVAVGVAKTILPEILKGLTDGLRYLNRVLRGEESGSLSIDFAGAWNSIKDGFSGLWDELKNLFGIVLPPLWDAFVEQLEDLGAWVWPRLKGWLERNWETVLIGLGAFLAGPSIIGALSSGLGGLFAGALGNVFGDMLGGSGPDAAGAEAAAAATGRQGSATQEVIKNQAATAQTITDNTDALVGAAAKIATLIGAGGAVTLLMQEVTKQAKAIKDQNLTAADVALAGGVLLAAGGFLLLIANTIKALGEAGIEGLLATAGAAAVAALATLFSDDGTGGVLTKFIDVIEKLTKRNGPLEKIFIFGKRMVVLSQQRGAAPGETKSILVEIGAVMAAAIGFLSKVIPMIKDINDLNLDQANSETLATSLSNIFAPISTFITGIVTHLAQIDNEKLKSIANMSGFITSITSVVTSVKSVIEVVSKMSRATQTPPGGKIRKPETQSLDFTWINPIFDMVGNVVNRIIWASRAFSGMDSETVRTTGQAIGSIVSAVSEAISAIAGIFTSGSIIQLLSQENPEQKINLLKDFITDMVNTLFTQQGNNTFIGALKSYIESVRDMTKDLSSRQIQGIGAVASLINSILSGLSGMTTAVMNFANLAQSGGGLMSGGAIDPILLGELMQFFGRMFDQLKTFLPDIIRNIQLAFNGIDLATFKSQVEALSPLLTTLNQLSTLTKNMFEIITGAGGGGADQNSFLEGLRRLNFMFKEGNETDPSIFSIVKNIINNLPHIQMNQSVDLSGLVETITQLKEIGIAIGQIKSVPALFDNELRKKTSILFKGGDDNNYPSIFSIARSIIDQSRVVSRQGRPGDLSGVVQAVYALKEIAVSLSEIPNQRALGSVGESIATMPELIRMLNDVLVDVEDVNVSNESVRNISRLIKAGSRLSGLSKTISNFVVGFRPALELNTQALRGTVAEMLGTVEDTVNAVNRIGAVPLTTTLERLSDNLGLGRSASYTINNQNFKLTINLKVVMDAGDLEHVFAQRSIENDAGQDVFSKTAFKNLPTSDRARGGA